MACLKCGKETEEGQVFCLQCRQVLAKYPVAPGIAIQLPVREQRPQEKTPSKKKRRAFSSKHALRRLVLWLTAVIAILTLVISILVALLLKQSAADPNDMIGRNYSVSTTESDGN